MYRSKYCPSYYSRPAGHRTCFAGDISIRYALHLISDQIVKVPLGPRVFSCSDKHTQTLMELQIVLRYKSLHLLDKRDRLPYFGTVVRDMHLGRPTSQFDHSGRPNLDSDGGRENRPKSCQGQGFARSQTTWNGMISTSLPI